MNITEKMRGCISMHCNPESLATDWSAKRSGLIELNQQTFSIVMQTLVVNSILDFVACQVTKF